MSQCVFTIGASDPEGDPLRFLLSTGTPEPLPSGMVLLDSGNGTATFNWTPALGQAGTYLVNVTVLDLVGESSASEEISITVNQAGCGITPGDIDGDCDVDRADLAILMLDRNKPLADSACGAPCDLDAVTA